VTLVYEVDGVTYLDRQARIRVLLDELNRGIDVASWAESMIEIQQEVDALPLVVGKSYRVRILGQREPGLRHRHYRTDTGDIVGLDLPAFDAPEFTEFDGLFRGRTPAAPFRGARGMLLFALDEERFAAIDDADVLRLEELVA